MAQTQFISHAPIAPSPTVVPRRGSGLFSALLVVLIILVGAGTGGLYMIAKSYDARVTDSEQTLADLERDVEIDSIKGAQSLEGRITRAQRLLDGHVYPSQVFNFLEDNTLASITFLGLQYTDGVIKVRAVAPSYMVLAQQIRHYRGLRQDFVQTIDFSTPKLTKEGEVEFAVDITLLPSFIHAQPASRISQISSPPNRPVENETKPENTSSTKPPPAKPPPPPAPAPTGEESL